MLYLFCGRERKADLKPFLQKFGSKDNFDVQVREVDIELSQKDDLLQQQFWDEFLLSRTKVCTMWWWSLHLVIHFHVLGAIHFGPRPCSGAQCQPSLGIPLADRK